MQTPKRALLSSAVFASLLCVATEPAQARVETFTVDEPLEIYPLYVAPGTTILIRLESAILETDAPKQWKLEPTINRSRDTIKLFVPAGVTAREVMSDYVVGTRIYDVRFEIQMADAEHPPIHALLVNHKNYQELLEAAVARGVAEKMAEEQAERDKDYQEAIDRATRNGKEQALLLELNNGHETTRLTGSTDCRGKGVVICGVEWNRFKEYGLLRVSVHNRTPGDIEYTRAQVFDEFEVRDHAGMVQVDDGAPMEPDATTIPIPRGGTVGLSIIVRDPAHVGNSAKLSLTGPVVAAASTFVDLSPPDGDIKLTVQPMVGLIGLENPGDDQDAEGVGLMGVGVRGTYKIDNRWALDGELTFARSGGAEFADSTYENMPGDVLMDVTLARLQVGGQMHFGNKVQFIIRAGIGFQGVNHDSRFTPDGGMEREGPKSGFAFDMVGSLGGELDARLGEHWHIGASFTGGMVVGHMLSKSALLGSVESSLHLGYEWSR